MLYLLINLICLVAVALTFFSPILGWLPILILDAYLLWTSRAAKNIKWKHTEELSENGNYLLQEYGHYYAMPFAGADFSSSASGLQLFGIAVGLIGLFKGFWLGVVIAAVNWVIMGRAAVDFNPTAFFNTDLLKETHAEIVAYLRARQSKGPR